MKNKVQMIKIDLTLGLQLLALISALLTPVLFIFGHISAYLYFSAFDIQYWKYTDLYTAFSFALESVEIVLSVIVTAILIAIMAWHFFKDDDAALVEAKKSFKSYLMVIGKKAIIAIPVLFTVAFLMSFVGSNDQLKEEISDKRYIPYELDLNKGDKVEKCLTSIGSIGQFQVFITQSLQPILVREDNINVIRQMFSPVPIKVFKTGNRSIENPNYDAEMKEWLSYWESVCPSSAQGKYKNFGFVRQYSRKLEEQSEAE